MKFVKLFLILFSPFLYSDWAEQTLTEMSLEDKIGQLFVLPICPLRGEDHLQDLQEAITQYHIGGILPQNGDPRQQISLDHWLQKMSRFPLLCLQDAEWGLSMRLSDTIAFPKNLTLGAIQDDSLLYRLGKEIGSQCKKIGIHINLSPVVDVNTHLKNPIIHARSFGENPEEVARKASALMRGMQEGGILTCAKHFPGHGSSSTDSHLGLPLLSEMELYPFEKMIASGVDAIMIGHLSVPSWDTLPATLSKKMVTDLLKIQLGFKGLVITDALNMKALSLHFSAEEIAVHAVLAGCDLLLYGDHLAPHIDEILRSILPKAFRAIYEACEKGVIAETMLNERVLHILKIKERLGIHENRFVFPSSDLLGALNSSEAKALRRELYRQAVTVIKNENGLLPLSDPQRAVLVEVEKMGEDTLAYLEELNSRNIPAILVLYGSPYQLSTPPPCASIVVAYEKNPDTIEAVLDVIAGKLVPRGKLPVTPCPFFPAGTGVSW